MHETAGSWKRPSPCWQDGYPKSREWESAAGSQEADRTVSSADSVFCENRAESAGRHTFPAGKTRVEKIVKKLRKLPSKEVFRHEQRIACLSK